MRDLTTPPDQSDRRPPRDARARRFGADAGGNVFIIAAIMFPLLLLLIAGAIDVSFAVSAKNKLQDATDAAALSVASAAAQNPNTTESALQAIAQTVLNADFPSASPQINDFHVCAPVQNDCTDGGATLANDSVKIAVSAPAPCGLGAFVPMFCINGGPMQTVNAATTTVIPLGATIQLNLVMDSSASMIVGATPADVTTISNWVTANWNKVKPGDPPPFTGGDNPPCAFACHDVGGSTNANDIAKGLTNAHSAGATTRFDVMVSAANQLINHVHTVQASNAALSKNTYVFNIFSFDTAIHKYGSSNMDFAAASTAVSAVSPGLDTYVDNAMSTFAGSGNNSIGTNGNGTSTASPLKFMILVSDGLQSDRSNNWGCNHWGWDNAWGYNTCFGGYAAPLNTANCTTLKNEGVVLAVLETPYVPLDGQDPQVAPYEKTVRHTIYPGGAGSQSTVSAALAACASTGYYFQANSAADIATGFLTLTDRFLAHSAYILK